MILNSNILGGLSKNLQNDWKKGIPTILDLSYENISIKNICDRKIIGK